MSSCHPPPRKRTLPAKLPSKKPKVQVVQEELDKELDTLFASLREPSKLFRQPPCEAPCPLHQDKILNKRTSRKGWEYVKCEGSNCPVFLPWDDLMVFTLSQLCQVHADLAEGLLCHCQKPCKLVLARKDTSPNQGRCFLTCAEKSRTKDGCSIFQWIDEPL